MDPHGTGALLDDIRQLEDADADDSILSGETVVLDLEHELVLLRFAFVSEEAGNSYVL